MVNRYFSIAVSALLIGCSSPDIQKQPEIEKPIEAKIVSKYHEEAFVEKIYIEISSPRGTFPFNDTMFPPIPRYTIEAIDHPAVYHFCVIYTTQDNKTLIETYEVGETIYKQYSQYDVIPLYLVKNSMVP